MRGLCYPQGYQQVELGIARSRAIIPVDLYRQVSMEQLAEAAKNLEDSRRLLEETRQSIERCEAIPKIDSLSAINYHRPAKRIKPPAH